MGIMADSVDYRYMIMANGNVPPKTYQAVLMEIQKKEADETADDVEEGIGRYEHIDLCYELIDEIGNILHQRTLQDQKLQMDRVDIHVNILWIWPGYRR